jgi:branched-chain amino acid transport system permease protein
VIPYPDWVNAQVNLGSLPLGWLDVITFVVTIVTLVGMSMFLRKSTTGIALRSAASDFDTTRLMGINANRVIVGAFLASGALAGLAAVLYFAESPFVDPTSGLTPVIKGFIATVIGGLGSLSGAVLGGFVLGALEVAIDATLPDSLAVYGDAFVFVIVIIVLLFRPAGLLGVRTSEGRA